MEFPDVLEGLDIDVVNNNYRKLIEDEKRDLEQKMDALKNIEFKKSKKGTYTERCLKKS